MIPSCRGVSRSKVVTVDAVCTNSIGVAIERCLQRMVASQGCGGGLVHLDLHRLSRACDPFHHESG